MGYKRIISDTSHEHKAIHEIIEEINRNLAIRNNDASENKYSLFNGDLGTALYYCYISKFSNKYQECRKVAVTILNEAIEQMAKEKTPLSFYDGVIGVGWMVNYFVQNDIIELLPDTSFSVLDENILNFAIKCSSIGDHDLLYGGIGAGLYFLSRLDSDYSFHALKKILFHINNTAITDSNGTKWKYVEELMFDKTVYNLGLAHGIPSIIVFLSKLYKHEIEQNQCEELIESSIQWLIRQQKNGSPSLFPSGIKEGEVPKGDSRLAWCYGDLGIGSCLYQAGVNCNNIQWTSIAKEIILHSVDRKNSDETGVRDASFCHGSAGIAHMYNRFYQWTLDDQYKSCALYWYKQALAQRTFKDGIAGYKSFQDHNNSWRNEKGLLNGVVGTGLSLFAAISNNEPTWDSCFLLS